jgi:hypothetical protein
VHIGKIAGMKSVAIIHQPPKERSATARPESDPGCYRLSDEIMLFLARIPLEFHIKGTPHLELRKRRPRPNCGNSRGQNKNQKRIRRPNKYEQPCDIILSDRGIPKPRPPTTGILQCGIFKSPP